MDLWNVPMLTKVQIKSQSNDQFLRMQTKEAPRGLTKSETKELVAEYAFWWVNVNQCPFY